MNNSKRRLNVIMLSVVAVILMAIMLVQPAFDIFAEIGVGKTQADYGPVYFESEYQTKEEMLAAAYDANALIADEGIVLLENKNNSLPLADKTITMFGSQDYLMSGGGSGTGIVKSDPGFECTFDEAFAHEKITASYVSDNEMYTSEALYSGKNAVVLISEYGSEDGDRPMVRDKGEENDGGHGLRLRQVELDRLVYAANNFENVIVLMNVCTQFEMGFIADPEAYFDAETGVMPMGGETSYAKDMTATDLKNIVDHLNSAVIIGYPGYSGLEAVANVLSGATNPSGRTISTWYNDFTKDPTFQNLGDNRGQGNETATGEHYVHYDEDIYIGYRYYETYAYDLGTKGEAWYQDNMNYPMGYGLSYSSFSYEIVTANTKPANKATIDEDTVFEVAVKVTNTGSVAGKEVVQLYYNAPYTAGGIEKAHVVLGNYEKTGMLKPNESEIVTIKMSAYDMRSYDWKDVNDNDICGYELEAGDYNFYVSNDSHSWYDIENTADKALKLTYTLAEDVYYDVDPATGNKVVNQFDEVSYGNSLANQNDGDDTNNLSLGVQTYFSRGDWEGTFPTCGADKKSLGSMKRIEFNMELADDPDMPWYIPEDEMPTQAETPGTVETNEVKLWHLSGRDYNDPLWDELLNQLTISEMAGLLSDGFGKTLPIESIDKPRTYDEDGPLGWTGASYGTLPTNMDECQHNFFYASNTICSQTYSRDMLYLRGRMQGMEGALGNIHEYNYYNYTGIYAPGANIHRSPFCGRNLEYMSEDPLVTGISTAYEIKGFKSMGVYTYMKHYILNEQEHDRGGLITWLSEQAMREIYARGFEIATKESQPTAMMNTFACYGLTQSASHYGGNTAMLRTEWGFQGLALTDYGIGINNSAGIRSGLDLRLADTVPANYNSLMNREMTATQVGNMRESAKRVLFAVANSNAINGHDCTRFQSVGTPGWNLTTVQGVNFSDNITAMASNRSNTEYDFTVSAGSLPAGLSLNNKTGEITGTATTAGTYTFTVIANEQDDAPLGEEMLFFPYTDVEATFTVTVLDKAPATLVYNDVAEMDANMYINAATNVNVAFARYFDENSQPMTDGITYTLADGTTLPSGLTLNADGTITGTAPAAEATLDLDIVATHPDYGTDTATITIKIIELKIIFDKEDLSGYEIAVGIPLEMYVAKATGVNNITYSVAKETPLPEGLMLDATYGKIVGTPIRGYEDYDITIIASAPGAGDKTQTYTITITGIVASDVTIKVQADRNFEIDFISSVNDGHVGHMFYNINDAALPTGVKLDTNGKLVGNISNVGTYELVIMVNCTGYNTVTFKLFIEVVNPDTNA